LSKNCSDTTLLKRSYTQHFLIKTEILNSMIWSHLSCYINASLGNVFLMESPATRAFQNLSARQLRWMNDHIHNTDVPMMAEYMRLEMLKGT
jgi:hypothetical protein